VLARLVVEGGHMEIVPKVPHSPSDTLRAADHTVEMTFPGVMELLACIEEPCIEEPCIEEPCIEELSAAEATRPVPGRPAGHGERAGA